LSEWCRQVLLDAAAGPAQAPEAKVILSEILALRKIVINLLHGEKEGEPLRKERIRELIKGCRRGKRYSLPTRRCTAVRGRSCPRTSYMTVRVSAFLSAWRHVSGCHFASSPSHADKTLLRNRQKRRHETKLDLTALAS